MPKKQSSADKLAMLIEEGAEQAAARWEESVHYYIAQCESPIEELLIAALYIDHDSHPYRMIFMGKCDSPYLNSNGEEVFIYQQAKVGDYRVDFLIHDCSVAPEVARPRWIIVECDGHDFHERTKEQARHDKKRDRYLQSLGAKVLRFTGSEIWADPEACAHETLSHLWADEQFRL
jgi:very-short-patch-repair endonuclease